MTQSRTFAIADYWGLAASPFPARPPRRGVTLTASQEEAAARMEFVVRNGRSGGLIVGLEGTGKTLLLEVFSERIRGIADAYPLSAAGMDESELLLRLSRKTGGLTATARNSVLLRQAIERRFAAAAYQHRRWVVLLDDTAAASPEIAIGLTYLSRLRWDDCPPPALFLTARPDEVRHIPRPCLNLLDLRIELEPWEPEDVEAYVAQRIRAAGREDWQSFFDPEAVRRIAELSGGIPREVNRLADLCLTAAAGADVRPIHREIVESVHEELYPHRPTPTPARPRGWEIRVR
ncbi:MAG: ExeA family protein [Thermogutta sp.]